LAIFTSPEFLAISFDASGATTGALTVPFILALALGVSSLKKDSKASEKDSFGLVAIASTGAIITVMIMNIVTQTNQLSGSLEAVTTNTQSILSTFLDELLTVTFEIIMALIPSLIVYLENNKISYNMSENTIP